MYCKKCGNEISEDTAFCPKCGTAQVSDTGAAGAAGNPTPQNETPSWRTTMAAPPMVARPPKNTRQAGIKLGIAAGIVGIACGGISLIYYINRIASYGLRLEFLTGMISSTPLLLGLLILAYFLKKNSDES